MPIIPEVEDSLDELTQIRRDIHAHPELGFEEERTADIVAAKLKDYGCEVHRGLATTGVIGTIRRGNSLRAIGLRSGRAYDDAAGRGEVSSQDPQFRRHGAFYLPARRGRFWWRSSDGRART